jgi:hypothetical protein
VEASEERAADPRWSAAALEAAIISRDRGGDNDPNRGRERVMETAKTKSIRGRLWRRPRAARERRWNGGVKECHRAMVVVCEEEKKRGRERASASMDRSGPVYCS